MKSVEQIKARFRDAAIATNPQADKAVLADVMQAGGLTHRKHPARNGPRIWRFLMESRITKLTAAGLVIAAAILGVHDFNGAAVKAVEFSEITKAMREVPWMHMTASGFQNGVSGPGEQWIGFEARTHAGKEPDGTIVFASEKDHKRFIHHPKTNTIRVTYMEAFPLNVTSPAALLESMHKVLEQQGAKTVARIGNYQGRQVQIQDISLSNVGGRGGSETVRLYLDPDSKRLYAAEVKGVDSAGHVVMAGNVTFDYPAAGPRSIYDLGVPREARVVDEAPSAKFSPVWEEYQRRRADLPNEYITVTVHQQKPPSEVVQMVDVDYRSGRKYRNERYYPHKVLAELGPQYREQLGRSLEPLLAWARHHYDDPQASLWLQFDDGQQSIKVHRDSLGRWGELEKDGSTGGTRVPMTLPQAWPIIAPTSQVIEDDYARQNGLIGIETLTQSQVSPEGKVGHPGRFLYYLDPDHDYLCRRQVMEWRPNADWQQDKDYLKGVDPKKVRSAAMLVCEIPEVFQAPNGHWYPRVIVEKERYTDPREDDRDAPLTVTDAKTIYLDVSPTFPEDIFDHNRLPGQ